MLVKYLEPTVGTTGANAADKPLVSPSACRSSRGNIKFGIGLDKIEIVINRYIKGGALSLGEIEKNFDKPVYWLAPNDFSEIVASINRGIPVVKLSPGAPFSKNMVEFIKKFQGILDDSNFRGIKGTFGKNI